MLGPFPLMSNQAERDAYRKLQRRRRTISARPHDSADLHAQNNPVGGAVRSSSQNLPDIKQFALMEKVCDHQRRVRLKLAQPYVPFKVSDGAGAIRLMIIDYDGYMHDEQSDEYENRAIYTLPDDDIFDEPHMMEMRELVEK